MIEKDNELLEDAIKQYKETGQITIFRSNASHANMKVERFVVPQNSTLIILDIFKLDKDKQERAINKLVDRTPDWLQMTTESQVNLIKLTLSQESVVYYLYETGTIRKDCSMYENSVDENGNIVIDAFYIEAKHTKEEIAQMQAEKIKQTKKIIPFKKKAGK